MWEILWGFKTVAAFDVWSIEHVLSGVSIGTFVTKKIKRAMRPLVRQLHKHYFFFDIVGVLFLAYLWETLEHYLEVGIAGQVVEFWFQGVEFWWNRFIFDPLMLIVGYYLAKKFPRIVWPVRGLSLLWLIVHIFVFPHSMYLHQIL